MFVSDTVCPYVDVYTSVDVNMQKKPSLAAALQRSANPGKPMVDLPDHQAQSQERAGPVAMAPSRIGLKTIAGHFDPAVSRQLRAIGLEEDLTVQALLAEALNDLFVKRGRSPIAR